MIYYNTARTNIYCMCLVYFSGETVSSCFTAGFRIKTVSNSTVTGTVTIFVAFVVDRESNLFHWTEKISTLRLRLSSAVLPPVGSMRRLCSV
jgi:hypothetical protein